MSKDTPDGDRIAKVLSRAGVASRRDAERMISEGRVKLNGKPVTSPALNVLPTDRITVDGKTVDAPEPTRVWLYHKPAGLVTSESDELGRATVFEQMPPDMPRVMSVGRLDLTSEGLLLLTNDGEIKRKLELPATGWLRRYRVRINGSVSEDKLDELRKGITVDGVDYQPMEVSFDRQQGANAWLTIAIREGKNREIRRVMDALGVTVNRLIRISYGPFQLGDLAPGAVEELARRVVRSQLGLDEDDPKPVVRARKPRPASERGGSERGAKPAGPVMRSTKGPRPGEDAPRPQRSYDKPRGDDADRGPRKPREDGDRPAKSFAAKPYAPRSADSAERPYKPRPVADGDRPARSFAKPGAKPYAPRSADSADRPYKPRPVADNDRPARSFPKPGAKPGAKPYAPRDTDSGDRPRAPYKPRAADGERPARAYAPKPGAKPYTPRGADTGDRPARSFDKPRTYDKPRAEGDRPARPYGGKPGAKPYAPRAADAGERPARVFKPRPVDGDRPAGKPYAPRGPKPGGDKPYGAKSFGTKSHSADRGPRPDGDAPRKPYAPRGDGAPRPPRSDAPRNDKPRSDKPRNDKPRGDGPPRPFRKGPGGGKS